MPPEPERDLAAFAAELETEAIPDRVRDRAGLTIADTLGAIVAGRPTTRSSRSRGAGPTASPAGRRCSAPTAARRSRRWRRSATARRAPSSNSTRGIGSPPATRRSTCCPRCWPTPRSATATVTRSCARSSRATRSPSEPPARSGRSNRGTTRTACGGGRRRGRSGTLADSTRRRRARPWPSRRTTRNTPGSRRRRRARPCGTSTPA